MKDKNKPKSEFRQRYGMPLIICTAGVIWLIAACVMHANWNAKLKDLEETQITVASEQAVAKSREEIAAQEESEAYEEEVRQEVTGMTTSRKETDDAIMADIMSYATTWSSSDTYMESRVALLKAYPWMENTSFMTMFFPSEESFILTDDSGEVINNYLDDGRNITFVSLESEVIAVDGDTYSYIAEVITQSVWSGTSSDGRILLTYDMTADGQALNLNAYVVAS